MKPADFLKHLSDERSFRRKLVLQTGFVLFLIILCAVLLGYSMNRKAEVAAKTKLTEQISQLSAEYDINKKMYDNNLLNRGTPIPREKLNMVHSAIISYLENARDIKVKSMSGKKDTDAGDKGKRDGVFSFEVSLIGRWENLMQLCYDLDNQTFAGQLCLINITSIHLYNNEDSSKNDLIADITYEIRTEEER